MCDKNVEEGPLWEGGGPAGEQGVGKEDQQKKTVWKYHNKIHWYVNLKNLIKYWINLKKKYKVIMIIDAFYFEKP